jgi:excisionase family DNA binding protein
VNEPSTVLPAVLDVIGAGIYLSVSADTVRRLIRTGSIPHVRVGNSIRIRRADLDAYLEARTSSVWKPVDGRGQPLAMKLASG